MVQPKLLTISIDEVRDFTTYKPNVEIMSKEKLEHATVKNFESSHILPETADWHSKRQFEDAIK
jgi:hypothetical protein